MKNYPLNPFSLKTGNWTQTYLKEINAKVFALRNYSEFFLTDFIPSELDYIQKRVVELDNPIYIIKTQVLSFHNYAKVSRDCYIYTEASDSNAIVFTALNSENNEDSSDTEYIYVRFIPAGTTIISNARPEGSIDANGIDFYNLTIYDEEEDVNDDLYASDNPLVEYPIWNLLGFSSAFYGPPNPELINWKNFILQPTGYSSLYSIDSIDNGLKFTFHEKGGEDYGNNMDIVLMFQKARFNYLGSSDNIRFNKIKTGVQLYAKASSGLPNIGTRVSHDSSDATIPWTSRDNPVMHFMYINRDSSNYGEEIICDNTWEVTTTKLVNVTTLVYNIYMNPRAYITGDLEFEAELV